MKIRQLIVATAAGLVLQLIMVLWGHGDEAVKALFAVVGMGISLLAGGLFAVLAKDAWRTTLIGGALAGGVCAIIGIAVSLAHGDVSALILVVGTLSSAVTGLIGSAVGKAISRV